MTLATSGRDRRRAGDRRHRSRPVACSGRQRPGSGYDDLLRLPQGDVEIDSDYAGFNLVAAGRSQFDPYPFILLNLVLSCLAAIQAPIIMMSQKRQEAKDRLRSENDYRVNLKAELEIRHLHEKMDHILTRQWERLAEIQQIQLEIMQDHPVKAR